MNDGFIVVDKPAGSTSHDVVAAVRRATGIKKVGHAGTLDPMATGALVVALGKATRLIRYVQDLDKEYEAAALFGVATDTLDADGDEVWRHPMPVDRDTVEGALDRFRGDILQVPPMVSALKVDGRRMYDLAREGVEVERPARPVTVYALDLVDFEPGDHPTVHLRVVCSKGTYVRSLADDLATSLGGRAHLVALRRTRVGHFDVDRLGLPIDRLDEWRTRLVAPADALESLEAMTVPETEVPGVTHGRRLGGEHGSIPVGDAIRLLGPDGTLLAVHRMTDAGLVPEVVLPA